MPDYVDDNQSELFQQLAAGSQLASQQIMQRNESLLFNRINRIVKNTDLAKEVLNDIFYILWLNREAVALKRKPIAWLMLTAKNRAINKMRHERKRESSPLSELLEIAGPSDAALNLELKEEKGLVEKAVTKLSPAEQKVYALMLANGWNRKDAAQQLNLSEYTVRNQLRNLMRSLRKHFEALRNLIVI